MKKLLFLSILIFSSVILAHNADNSSAPLLLLDYTPNGTTLTTPNSEFNASLSGLLQVDAMKFAPNNQDLSSGANIHRARLYLDGQLTSAWGYDFSYDFRANDLLLAQIRYFGWENMQLSMGQIFPSFSISNNASDASMNTLELPLPVEAFSPLFAYYLGTGYNVWNEFLTLQLAVFGPHFPQNMAGKIPLGGTARLVCSPIHTETKMFELGLSGWTEKSDGSNSFIVGSVPEIQSHEYDAIVYSGIINHVNSYGSVGAEMAAIYGPWSAQMEYLQMHINRSNNNPNLKFSGYYFTGSYFLTGESLVYSFPNADFEGKVNIHNKKLGAWEVLVRYSTLNLDDADVAGGKENDITLGLNWYLNQHVKFLVNYVYAMAKPGSNGENDNVNSIAARMQLVF